jgi:hypothetical protein
VQDSEPSDYFRRILSGEVDEGEVRDQTVLKDIAEWLAGRQSAMIEKLACAQNDDDAYVSIWEYFAGEIPSDRLNEIIDALFGEQFLSKPIVGRMSAVMSCWRERNRRHDKSIVDTTHLQLMIRKALETNLSAANDLYYFWTSVRYGPFDENDRAMVRRGMVEAAKELYSDANRLITAVDVPEADESYGWSIRHLVEPPDQDEPVSELRDLKDWQWLGPVLLKAAELSPLLILGQTARLVGLVRQQVQARRESGLKETYELVRDRYEALFGEQSERLLHAFAGVHIAAEDWILASAQKESVGILQRLQSTRAAT